MKRCKFHVRGWIPTPKRAIADHNYKYNGYQLDYIQYIKQTIYKVIDGVAKPVTICRGIKHYKI